MLSYRTKIRERNRIAVEVIAAILTAPSNFCMRTWVTDAYHSASTVAEAAKPNHIFDRLREHTCGTAGCIAGWVLALAPKAWFEAYKPATFCGGATMRLQIDHKIADALFLGQSNDYETLAHLWPRRLFAHPDAPEVRNRGSIQLEEVTPADAVRALKSAVLLQNALDRQEAASS